MICGNDLGNRIYSAKEMMLGLRDTFEYLECPNCGCIQLLNRPSDWSRYYPSGYYAFNVGSAGAMKVFLKRARARYALGERSTLGCRRDWDLLRLSLGFCR
jgi:hypothetical protein